MISRFLSALSLLAMLVTPVRADSVTFSRDATPIVSADWADLGAGPALVQNHSAKTVYVAAAPTKPSANAIGHSLTAEMGARAFDTTLHLWARAAVDATAATSPVVEVTALTAAGKVLPREDAAQADAVTGSITASGQSITLPMAGYNAATFAFFGTYSGVIVTFEASYDGGANWQLTVGVQTSGGGPGSNTGPISTSGVWLVYAPGSTHVRARSTGYTSGSANVRLIPIVMSGHPSPSIGTVNTITNAAAYANVATSTNGGLSTLVRLLSAAASTNATLVKNAGGRLYKIVGHNASGSVRYLKVYNKASAPTVGTDTPVATFALAPSAAFSIDFAPIGVTMTTGISFGLTTGVADSDTGALTAGDIVGLVLFYQ